MSSPDLFLREWVEHASNKNGGSECVILEDFFSHFVRIHSIISKSTSQQAYLRPGMYAE